MAELAHHHDGMPLCATAEILPPQALLAKCDCSLLMKGACLFEVQDQEEPAQIIPTVQSSLALKQICRLCSLMCSTSPETLKLTLSLPRCSVMNSAYATHVILIAEQLGHFPFAVTRMLDEAM